jgi:hypothetical protein
VSDGPRTRHEGDAAPRRRGRALRAAVGVAYWLAVLVVSLALVAALLLFLESRDASQLREAGSAPRPPATERASGVASAGGDAYEGLGARPPVPARSPAGSRARSSRANTTIRWAALYSGWQAVSTRRS